MNSRYVRFSTGLALIAAMLACTLFEDIAAGSGTWYVATTGDDSNDCLSEASPCRTIQAAIDRATTGGNIHIADGIYTERVHVNKDGLRIFGAGEDATIIDAAGSGAALTISYEGAPGTGILDVLITKLTVQNGSADRGAGVYIAGDASALLVLMQIRDSTARLGAGLANDGTARLNDVRIVSNHASVSCGGVDNTGMLDMFRGEVSENSTDGYGGGICNESGARLTMRAVEVLGNAATIFSNVGAGGIYNAGRLGVYWGLIDGNRSRGNGGGIFDAGEMSIGRVTLSHNETAQEGAAVFTCAGRIVGSTINNNTGNSAVFAEFGGGFITGPGVCTSSDVFLLSNSTISGNDFIGISVQGNVRLESSTVAYNNYGLSISGLLVDTPQEDWYIRNMLFVYNTAGDCIDPPPFMPTAGHNLDSDGSCPLGGRGDLSDRDPALEALSDNGGGTWTHELLGPYASNPAIDAGGSDCPATDQRGVMRPQDLDGDGRAECDIGAFEVEEFGRVSIPLEAATPTPIGSPEPAMVEVTKNAFCRKGPGVNYDDVETLLERQAAMAEGRNEDGTWWFILHPDGTTRCWISNTTVKVSGPVDQLPLLPAPALPDEPAQFVVKDRVCTPNGFSLSLSWTGPGTDLSGYRLYRNGELIATLNPNKASYDDNPPMNQFLSYELATYNEHGSSNRLLLEDSGCP